MHAVAPRHTCTALNSEHITTTWLGMAHAQAVEPGTGNSLIRFQVGEGRYEEPLEGWNAAERECVDKLKNRTATFSMHARECAMGAMRAAVWSSCVALHGERAVQEHTPAGVLEQPCGLIVTPFMPPAHAQAPSATARWCACGSTARSTATGASTSGSGAWWTSVA